MVTFIADVFWKILGPKKMVRLMSKKPCFSGGLDTEDEKSVETMFQSE